MEASLANRSASISRRVSIAFGKIGFVFVFGALLFVFVSAGGSGAAFVAGAGAGAGGVGGVAGAGGGVGGS